MMLTQERMNGMRRMRKQKRLSAVTSKKAGTEQGQNGKLSHDLPMSKRHPIPVMFWTPDGACDTGTLPYGMSDLVFIESSRSVHVGSEVAVRLIPPNEAPSGRGVVQGTVVWQCTSEDHFQNGKGFGVSLHGRWPQPPVPQQAGQPTEAA